MAFQGSEHHHPIDKERQDNHTAMAIVIPSKEKSSNVVSLFLTQSILTKTHGALMQYATIIHYANLVSNDIYLFYLLEGQEALLS